MDRAYVCMKISEYPTPPPPPWEGTLIVLYIRRLKLAPFLWLNFLNFDILGGFPEKRDNFGVMKNFVDIFGVTTKLDSIWSFLCFYGLFKVNVQNGNFVLDVLKFQTFFEYA